MKSILVCVLISIVGLIVYESGFSYSSVLGSPVEVGYFMAFIVEIIIILACIYAKQTKDKEKIYLFIAGAVLVSIGAASIGRIDPIVNRKELTEKENKELTSLNDQIDLLKYGLTKNNGYIESLKRESEKEVERQRGFGSKTANYAISSKRDRKLADKLLKAEKEEESRKSVIREKMEKLIEEKNTIIKDQKQTSKLDKIKVFKILAVRIVLQFAALLFAHWLGNMIGSKDEHLDIEKLLKAEREQTKKEKERADKAESDLKAEKIRSEEFEKELSKKQVSQVSNVIDLKTEIPEKQAIGYRLPEQVKTGNITIPDSYEKKVIDIYLGLPRKSLAGVCRKLGKGTGGNQSKPIREILEKHGVI